MRADRMISGRGLAARKLKLKRKFYRAKEADRGEVMEECVDALHEIEMHEEFRQKQQAEPLYLKRKSKQLEEGECWLEGFGWPDRVEVGGELSCPVCGSTVVTASCTRTPQDLHYDGFYVVVDHVEVRGGDGEENE